MGTAKGYTGQYADATGLDYYNARYYDPIVGRFVSADTVQSNEQGMDPYAYVGGNPETDVDPTGQRFISGDSTSTSMSAMILPGRTISIYSPGLGNTVVSPQGTVTFWPTPPVHVYHAPRYHNLVERAVSDIKSLWHHITNPRPVPNPFKTSCNLSFTPQTSVATAKGSQSIVSLHVGENVWAYNVKTHKRELQPIVRVWINHDNDLVDLTITSTKIVQHGKGKQKTSEVIHTTEKHPFLTVEKGFLPVHQLYVGMHIVSLERGSGRITQLKIIPGAMTMYNLEVAQDHNFTVGDGQWVVHNCGSETPQEILNRLKSQLSVRQGKNAIRGSNSKTTKSISELYNSNGKQVGRGISESPVSDSALGTVQCSEGNCLINGRSQLQSGQTYNLYTAQKDGQLPCLACREDLQITADAYGVTFNAYSIGKNGDMGDTLTFRPQTNAEYPDVVWDEEIPLFDL